ncbi:MAG: peptide-methionine (S)-S-oxide reductase MsrA [Chloroflexi bacterium]|nr:peptide-methionine (S)-S-oxide reductase MsrA [Chloroflexota bacterium]
MSQQRQIHRSSREIATLGGGCFWCLEAVYALVKGVERVEPGYAGGHAPHPTYEQVCSGATGHAEVVQMAFDPGVVSYRELLEIFFTIHDPTTLNRQGADVGSQYRSVIFYHDEAQKQTAQQVMAEIEAAGVWSRPLVTELSPFTEFFRAEEYHRNYFARHPDQGYCQVVIAPKVLKFRQRFASKLR